MNAGELKHRITFQTLTDGQDTFGDLTETWTDYKTVSAKIEATGGVEYYASKQLDAEVTHIITIRYLTGLTNKHRISYDSRYFDIHFIDNKKEAGKKMEIQCVEVV